MYQINKTYIVPSTVTNIWNRITIKSIDKKTPKRLNSQLSQVFSHNNQFP